MKMEKENMRVGNNSFLKRGSTTKRKKASLSRDLKTPRRRSAGNDPSRRILMTPETLVSELPKDLLKTNDDLKVDEIDRTSENGVSTATKANEQKPENECALQKDETSDSHGCLDKKKNRKRKITLPNDPTRRISKTPKALLSELPMNYMETNDYLKVDENDCTSENGVSIVTKANKQTPEDEGLLRMNDKKSEQADVLQKDETSDFLGSLEKPKNRKRKITLPNDSTVDDKVKISKKRKTASWKLSPIKKLEARLKSMRITVKRVSPVNDKLATLLKKMMNEVEKVSPVHRKLETYLNKMNVAVYTLATRVRMMITKVEKLKKQKKIAVEKVSPINDKLLAHLTESTTGLQKDSPVGDKFKTKNDKSKTIFVGNLPVTVTKNKLEEIFKIYGEVKKLILRPVYIQHPEVPRKEDVMQNGIPRETNHRIAYVKFAERSSALKSLELNGASFDGLVLRVEMVKEYKLNREKCVFLGNLACNTEEYDIRSHFQSCGEIRDIKLIRDIFSELGKGIGYVEFENKESIELALKINESTLCGQSVRVQRSRAKGIKNILYRQR